MARINGTPLGGGLSQSEVDARVAAGITGKADSSALSGLVSSSDLSTALSSKADSSALTGLVSSGDLATALSSKADSSALSGLASTSDVMGALSTSGGIQLRLDPVSVEGDGTEQGSNLSMAGGFSPTTNHKYEIRGVIRANEHGGSRHKIVHVRIEGLVLLFNGTGDGWTVDDAGSVVLDEGTDANPFFLTNFYARAGSHFTVAEAPAIGTSGDNLQVISTVLNGVAVDMEFDGTITDHGTSGAA